MLELNSSYHYLMCRGGELGSLIFNPQLGSNSSLHDASLLMHPKPCQVSKFPEAVSWASSLLWNPHHLRPLHVGDDVLGHPNGVVPTPFLLPNLVSNHLAIGFLLDHIGGAIALVPLVGLGVDERTHECEFLFVLLIRKLLLWLRAFVGLVVFVMAL